MKKSFKSVLLDLLKGAGMGFAAIIPGVSGGTIAVLFKIYDKMIDAVNHLKTEFKKSVLYLLPILIGVVLAIAALWYPLSLAFEHIMLAVVCLFAGFILGGIPTVTDNIKHEKIKPTYIVVLVITLAVAIFIGVASVLFKSNVQETFNETPWWLYIVMIPVGVITACALIVPGISGSMILLVLGFYTPILNLLRHSSSSLGTHLNIFDNPLQTIGLLLCLAVGVIIGVFLISKIMGVLLNKWRTATYYGILGFILGSIVSLFYNNEIYDYYTNPNKPLQTWEIILGVCLAVVGCVGSYLIVVYARKHKNNNEIEEQQIETKGEQE